MRISMRININLDVFNHWLEDNKLSINEDNSDAVVLKGKKI